MSTKTLFGDELKGKLLDGIKKLNNSVSSTLGPGGRNVLIQKEDVGDFFKYLKGIELWEMGYVFSKTIGIHAPALNMHLAFVSIINLYFLLKKGSNLN